MFLHRLHESLGRLLADLSGRAARRFLHQADGAAAVEFALVGLPFLALIFAIIETAMVFFAGQALQTATTNVGRLILTGQAQAAGYTASTFKDAVCNQIAPIFNCTSGVYVSVQTYSSFASASTTAPTINGQLDTSNLPFSMGGPNDVVVVQLYYLWPIYVSLLDANLVNQSGNSRLLVGTAVFQNEPYSQ